MGKKICQNFRKPRVDPIDFGDFGRFLKTPWYGPPISSIFVSRIRSRTPNPRTENLGFPVRGIRTSWITITKKSADYYASLWAERNIWGKKVETAQQCLWAKVIFGNVFFLYSGEKRVFFCYFLTFPIVFVGKTRFWTSKKIISGFPFLGAVRYFPQKFSRKQEVTIPSAASDWGSKSYFISSSENSFAHKRYWEG